MNFDHENKNHQIMLFCFLLAICFLFMPWSGNYSGAYRASYGIEDYGFFFLLPWIATARWIYKNEPYNKYLAFALALLHTILIFIRIFSVKYAFIGLWLTSACSLIWLYCCYKEYENNKASNNTESKKIRGNRASKADTSFNTNDYVKLEPSSIFKYITRAYFFVAAADGKIDSSEEDNLKNYLGSLATDLSDGDQNKFLNYCNYFDEIINSSKINVSKNLDYELEMINKYCDQYSDTKYIFAPLTYKVLISGIVSDKRIDSKELQCLRKIDQAFDVYNCKDLSDFKHKEVFKLDVSEIIKYYKDIIAQINLNFGKKRVIEYLNTQYSRWKAMEQSSESSQRTKSLNIQKQILQFRKLYK